jgi:hypothetical protein
MTLEERANAIAACRNGVVQGSHLHKRLTAFAVQMMREAIAEERERCAKVVDKFAVDYGKWRYVAFEIATLIREGEGDRMERDQ